MKEYQLGRFETKSNKWHYYATKAMNELAKKGWRFVGILQEDDKHAVIVMERDKEE